MIQNSKQINIHEKLIDTSAKHDLQEIKLLIGQGANTNYVRYRGGDGSYKGNASTALYMASLPYGGVIQNQENYINVIQVLLKNGADPKFKGTARGPWGQLYQTQIFQNLSSIIKSFKNEKQIPRFLRILTKYKVNINRQRRSQRAQDCGGFRRTKCLLFDSLDRCGIGTKMYELVKLSQTVDFHELRHEHQEQQKRAYEQSTSIHIPKKQYFKYFPKNMDQKPINIQFIKQLILSGVDPNSSRSQWDWSNRESQMGNHIKQFDFSERNQFQTALHRCIMNNQVQLVRFLLERGAKVDTKCKYTVSRPVYPNQWPIKMIQRKQKQNLDSLKESEESLKKLIQKIAKTENEQQRQKLQSNLIYRNFTIFKAKRYNIENQCPLERCEQVQIDCLGLADKFQVNEEIIRLLKQKSQQKQKQKYMILEID